MDAGEPTWNAIPSLPTQRVEGQLGDITIGFKINNQNGYEITNYCKFSKENK